MVKIVPACVPSNAPYLPATVTQEQAWALKALMVGRANKAEQGMALRFILHTLCEVDAMTYRPDERDHVFADGKRFIGHQIARICRMGPETITRLPKLQISVSGIEDDEMPTS